MPYLLPGPVLSACPSGLIAAVHTAALHGYSSVPAPLQSADGILSHLALCIFKLIVIPRLHTYLFHLAVD